MSPALPQVSGKDTVRALERAGFEHKSTKGSHLKLRTLTVVVPSLPLHRGLARATLGSVLRQAGLTAAEFRELLS